MTQNVPYREGLGVVARSMRERAGLSRTQVAKATRISIEWIRQLEVDDRVISEELLARFAEATLPDEQEQLMKAAGYREPTDTLEILDFALRGVTDLSDEAKDQVRDFVRELQERFGPKSKGENGGEAGQVSEQQGK